MRFHFLDDDPDRRRAARAHRDRRRCSSVTTVARGRGARCSPGRSPSRCWAPRSPDVMRAAALGLWAFTNLELAYALLRVEERARAYAIASLANVAADRRAHASWLVVVRDEGALGPAARQLRRLGGRAARAVVGRCATRSACAGDGAPLRPDAALRAADRPRRGLACSRCSSSTGCTCTAFASAGRGRPLLALGQARRRRRLHGARVPVRVAAAGLLDRRRRRGRAASTPASRPTTCSFTGLVVAGLTLLGRWIVRLLAAPEFFAAHEALPWVALGWALYGLFLVLVAMAGRAQVTCATSRPRCAGLAVNVVAARAARRRRSGIAGAGLALWAPTSVMLVVMYAAHALAVPRRLRVGAAGRSSSCVARRARRRRASCCCRPDAGGFARRLRRAACCSAALAGDRGRAPRWRSRAVVPRRGELGGRPRRPASRRPARALAEPRG